MVEASTCWGAYASLLVHQLYGRLELVESLWTDARVFLEDILYVDEGMHDLGMFFFVALHLFYMFRIHYSAVTELFYLIERL